MNTRSPRGRGRYILITGPDGTGKSTLADQLVDELGAHRPVRRFHHRLRALPASRASRELTTTPHANRPYPPWLSRLKVCYLFIDSLLGWMLKVAPFVRSGGIVIVERGWWDVAVDPRRYRLGAGERLAARLGRFLPRHDVVIVLDAPPHVVTQRKAELPRAELERQLDSWRRLAGRITNAVLIDAAVSPNAVLSQAIVAAGMDTSDAMPCVKRLLKIPPVGRAQWLLPRTPREAARAGLQIHQPMTTPGRVAWEFARLVARTGLLAVLPAQRLELPPAVSPMVADEGHVAIFRGRVPGRLVVLLMDRGGAPVGVAKIASDSAGRRRLDREAQALRRAASMLRPPLCCPAVLAHTEGMLVTASVPWIPRSRPWHLPVDLATAMGELASPSGDRDIRLMHGDFAPWNVLRVPDGWCLIDWEESELGGSPLDDPIHYLVQAHVMLRRPREDEIVAGLYGRGGVGASLSAYAKEAGIGLPELRDAARSYLTRSLATVDPTHPAAERSRDARVRLLRTLEVG